MKFNYYMNSTDLRNNTETILEQRLTFDSIKYGISKAAIDNLTKSFTRIAINKIPGEYLEQLTCPKLVSIIIVNCFYDYMKDHLQEFSDLIDACNTSEVVWLPAACQHSLARICGNINKELSKKVFEPDIEGYRGLQAFNLKVYTQILSHPAYNKYLVGPESSSLDVIGNNAHALGALTKWLVSTVNDLITKSYSTVDLDMTPEVIYKTITKLFTFLIYLAYLWKKLIMFTNI